MKNSTKNSVALAISFLLSIGFVVYNPAAQVATRYTQQTTEVAGTMYVSYRVINRVVEMIADTDVQAGLGVASVSMSPGKVLQSLLDTLQRFADVLFGLMIVSGLLSVVMLPVAKLGAALAAAGFAGKLANGFATSPAGARPGAVTLERVSRAAVRLGVFFALIVPLGYAGGARLGDFITSDSWNRSTEAFSSFTSELETTEAAAVTAPPDASAPAAAAEAAPKSEDDSFLGGLMGAISSSAQSTGELIDGAIGGAVSAGNQGYKMLLSIPEIQSKVGDLVAASFDFLIAYLVKVLVLPLVIGGTLLWVLRQGYPAEYDLAGPASEAAGSRRERVSLR
jgi:hypothetical protein